MTQKVSDIQLILTPIFEDYDITRAVLFGSIAKGTDTEKSEMFMIQTAVQSGFELLSVFF